MATVEIQMPKVPRLLPSGWSFLTTFFFGLFLAMSMSVGGALYEKYLAEPLLKLLPG